MFKKFAAAALMLCLAVPAFAQDATPGLDKREGNMEQRIGQGKQSGQLNAKEAARLERKEARLKQAEDRAKADGQVTPQERKKLDKKADKLSKDIYREKHDKQVAPPQQ